ncbi:DDE-type integrase/transposase/recombinase, partial [Yersinia massiliensis]|uniref:DDE-type integrase/transposase/recombinase n=1 Tax=Yersinia massiliensis TaxID=419257 RepID=UPI00117BEE68
APILRQKLRRYQFTHADSSWQLDETYIKVNGKWFYLYRAINKGSVALTKRRRKNGRCLFFRQPTDKIVPPVTTLHHRDDQIVL